MTSESLEETLNVLPWSLVSDLIPIFSDDDMNNYSFCALLQLCYSWHTSFSDDDIYILTQNGKVYNDGLSFIVFSKMHLVIFNIKSQNSEKVKLFLKQFVEMHHDWSNIEFGPVEERFWVILEETMQENKMEKGSFTLATRHFMDKELAKTLFTTCPEEIYIAQLKEEDAQLMDSLWPHRFDGSLDQIKMTIERNGGVGVYLKENDALVSWALHGFYNGPQILQTVESHKRKGYGYLTASAISKYVAEKDIHPVVYIVDKNTPSQLLFAKLGYQKVGNVKWYHFIEKQSS